MPDFRELKVGDRVQRWVTADKIDAGLLPVTEIDDKLIHCGPWTFDKTHGYEVDEEFGFGVPDENNHVVTGSWIEIPSDISEGP